VPQRKKCEGTGGRHRITEEREEGHHTSKYPLRRKPLLLSQPLAYSCGTRARNPADIQDITTGYSPESASFENGHEGWLHWEISGRDICPGNIDTSASSALVDPCSTRSTSQEFCLPQQIIGAACYEAPADIHTARVNFLPPVWIGCRRRQPRSYFCVLCSKQSRRSPGIAVTV
jgi:hypothetical protein